MEPPRYDGTIHPERWIENVELYCKLNQITDADEILELCLLLIDIPMYDGKNDISDTEELVDILKQDPHFIVFKNKAKRKLSCMVYEDADVNFMKEFLLLCNDAEILEEINEVKRCLFQTLNHYEQLQDEFVNKVENIHSINEVIKIFEEITFGQNSVIKYGNTVALKHVLSGKYMTSVDKYYEDSQDKQIVFVNKSLPTSDSIWVITSIDSNRNGEELTYENSKIGFINEKTYNALCYSNMNDHKRVYCDTFNNSDVKFHWKIVNDNSKKFVRSGDFIYIDDYSGNSDSHDYTFQVNNNTYKFPGVVGNQWCIELI